MKEIPSQVLRIVFVISMKVLGFAKQEEQNDTYEKPSSRRDKRFPSEYRVGLRKWFGRIHSGLSRICFREDVSGRLVVASCSSFFEQGFSRVRREQGVPAGPESARRILIMRAKLWASSRRWNICVFAGRGLWLNYHWLFPLRAVDLRRPLPAPERTSSAIVSTSWNHEKYSCRFSTADHRLSILDMRSLVISISFLTPQCFTFQAFLNHLALNNELGLFYSVI